LKEFWLERKILIRIIRGFPEPLPRIFVAAGCETEQVAARRPDEALRTKRMKRPAYRLGLAVICTLLWLSRATAQPDPADTLVLINARIYDVSAGSLDDQPKTIRLSGKHIRAIDESAAAETANQLDLQGRVVLPGLIDLHSHLLLHPYDEATWNEQVLNESLELRTIRGTVAARDTLAAGFTTLRDLGTEGAGFADVALRDAIRQGIIPGPRVFTVTRALVITGGYGPMGFDPRWEMPVGAQAVNGVAECRKATRQQIAAGADWIKIYADYRRRPGDPATPTFSPEELQAIVSEATSAGIPVAAHATTDEGIRRSVMAGVRTIEHGYDASLETLQLMKERQVVLCPTLTASESIARYAGRDPAEGEDSPRIEAAKQLMKRALQAGVTIACGSDVGVFTHGDNARELELMFAYGMPLDEVLRSATMTAAGVLGMESLGQLQPGFLADLIVVNDNPLENLVTLRDPLVVIRDGQLAVNRLNQMPAATTGSLTGSQPAETGDDVAAMLKQLDMPSPTIIEVNPGSASDDAADSDRTERLIDPNRKYFRFRLQPDGTYSRDGEVVAPGDLARLIAVQQEQGIRDVKVIVSSVVDYRQFLTTQDWLKKLGVKSVQFEVTDE
jgi:imidazolonepropionase-like amidohydrolase